MVLVVHQAQHRGGAGSATEQLPKALLRREGQPGGADLMGQVLGVKGLIRPHEQQVKLGFLPVAEEEVLADGHAQDLADGGALLHGVGGLAGHDFCCQRLIGMFRAMEQASSPLCNRSDPAPEKLFGAWIYNEEWLRWHCLADRTKNIV